MFGAMSQVPQTCIRENLNFSKVVYAECLQCIMGSAVQLVYRQRSRIDHFNVTL